MPRSDSCIIDDEIILTIDEVAGIELVHNPGEVDSVPMMIQAHLPRLADKRIKDRIWED